MFYIPVIYSAATGANICRLRKAAGLSVKDLQDVFGFGMSIPVKNYTLFGVL